MRVKFNGNCRLGGVTYRRYLTYDIDDSWNDNSVFKAWCEDGRVEFLDSAPAQATAKSSTKKATK